jgi:hypothetical protein
VGAVGAFQRYQSITGRYSISVLAQWAVGWSVRVLTSRLRVLPDFVIIGAQRCGTTSLYNHLVTHPNVIAAFKKETLFFSNYYAKGRNWYRAHFALGRRKGHGRRRPGPDLVTGEASPYYLFHPHAPRRARETVPNARLIALLRNPVDRAYSHYHHEVKMGLESLSFEDALAAEGKRLSQETPKVLEDENYRSFNHQNYSYLARGVYVDQLENWARSFGRNQLLVLRSEDFDEDPARTLRQVIEFMDLPKWELGGHVKYHLASYPPMDATTKQRLTAYFEPHNQRLYEFLGLDLGWES